MARKQPIAEIFKGDDEQWWWRVRGKNNKVSAVGGEGFTRKSGAIRALAGVRKIFGGDMEIKVIDDTAVGG